MGLTNTIYNIFVKDNTHRERVWIEYMDHENQVVVKKLLWRSVDNGNEYNNVLSRMSKEQVHWEEHMANLSPSELYHLIMRMQGLE